jgi:acetate kinase
VAAVTGDDDSGPCVLAVNAGSSSLKVALFTVSGAGRSGEIERWRHQLDADPGATPDLAEVADRLRDAGLPQPTAIGHRVVHGGPDHVVPEVIDERVVDELEALVPLAPLHQPAALAGIAAASRTWPGRPQVACFDTAFHHTLEPAAFTLALPEEVRRAGVRRYGFHGLSYESVVDQLSGDAPGRTVIAHLGAGASMCAVADGRSVDTTMGMTPSGGLVMATRPGDLDPGVLVHLLRQPPVGMSDDAAGLEELLDHRSGLLGLSGRTGDVRELLEARGQGDERARLALAVFVRTAAKHVAAMASALDGLDTLVFTGGIGQHAPAIRAEIAGALSFLAVEVDPAANQAAEPVISTPGGVTVRVVATDEERMIARHTAELVTRPD